MAQSKNERIGIRALIFFSAVGQIFIGRSVAQNLPPVQTLNERLHFLRVHARGIESADQSPNARPRNVIHGNMVLLEPLKDPDVRQAQCATAFERHANYWTRDRKSVV